MHLSSLPGPGNVFLSDRPSCPFYTVKPLHDETQGITKSIRYVQKSLCAGYIYCIKESRDMKGDRLRVVT